MAIKRKYTGAKYGKSKRFRRMRFLRKLWSRPVPPRKAIVNINRNPISYTREIPLNNLNIPIGSNWIGFSNYFTIANLPNLTEFTGLFDQYRIRTVIMKFRLVNPPEGAAVTAPSQFYPDIYVTVDHDDNVTPTSVDSVLQYGKCKRGVLRPNQWFTYKCHPTPALQLYRTATTTAYAPAKSTMWLDLAQTDCPFYGIKGIISNEASGVVNATLAIECHIVMYVQFKNSR